MRIALLTLAAPWPARPTLGLYNTHQVRALRELGHDARIFTLTPWLPAPLAPWSERIRSFRSRRGEYEFAGAPIHCAEAVIMHPERLKDSVAPVAPRLASWSIAAAAAGPLDRFLDSAAPDALLAHSGVLWKSLLLRASRGRGIPFAVIEHDIAPLNARQAEVYRPLAEASRAVFVVGEQVRERLSSIGIPNVRLVRNGVVLATDEQLSAKRRDDWLGRQVVLCAGAYTEAKGHEFLVRAFARAAGPRAILALVGEPPRRLAQLAGDLGISERLQILPVMPQVDLIQHMVWADVFALPAWNESFGLVFAEALGAGTPVIMSSDCGMAREITAGEHGWITPPRQVGPLADALAEALASSDLGGMGRAGRELVSERFSWRRNAETIADVFQPQEGPVAM